jgi:hypothetical protein
MVRNFFSFNEIIYSGSRGGGDKRGTKRDGRRRDEGGTKEGRRRNEGGTKEGRRRDEGGTKEGRRGTKKDGGETRRRREEDEGWTKRDKGGWRRDNEKEGGGTKEDKGEQRNFFNCGKGINVKKACAHVLSEVSGFPFGDFTKTFEALTYSLRHYGGSSGIFVSTFFSRFGDAFSGKNPSEPATWIDALEVSHPSFSS